MNNQPKSKCCNAEILTHSGDEGTNHYRCSKCGLACDVATVAENAQVQPQQEQDWEAELELMLADVDLDLVNLVYFIRQLLEAERERFLAELRQCAELDQSGLYRIFATKEFLQVPNHDKE